ncbi:flagellar hook assembly protein FlgD [Buchnera aphidicola]|uniref:flagellar hook assembly protein FlgD n=1 Tax=Buchnera aphidicola TaxID=9 RepID=UPI0031B68EE7
MKYNNFEKINSKNINTGNKFFKKKNFLNSSTIQKNFLKVLKAEISNQDPTKPIKNSTLTSQITQMQMNDRIHDVQQNTKKILQQINTNQFFNAVNLINRKVLINNNKIFDIKKTKIPIFLKIFKKSKKVQMNIFNSYQQKVFSKNLGNLSPGIHKIYWDSKKDFKKDSFKKFPYTVNFTVQKNKCINKKNIYTQHIIKNISKNRKKIYVTLDSAKIVKLHDLKKIF